MKEGSQQLDFSSYYGGDCCYNKTLKCSVSWVTLLSAALDYSDHWSLTSTCNTYLQTTICGMGEFSNYMPSASQSRYTASPFVGYWFRKMPESQQASLVPLSLTGEFLFTAQPLDPPFTASHISFNL